MSKIVIYRKSNGEFVFDSYVTPAGTWRKKEETSPGAINFREVGALADRFPSPIYITDVVNESGTPYATIEAFDAEMDGFFVKALGGGTGATDLLGGIAHNAAAPTPGVSGKYYFTSAGVVSWITGTPTVSVGDTVLVIFNDPTYTYTYVPVAYELLANKKTTVTNSDTDYPTGKAVSVALDLVKKELGQEISSLENTLNSANINQETTATVTGVDTIALPKTAANTGMQAQMFGQSASEEISLSSTTAYSSINVVKTAGKPIYTATSSVNTVTLFGFDISKPVVVGEKYYARLKVKLITGTYTSIDLLLRGSTSGTQSIILQTINSPVLNTQYSLSGVGTLTSAITGLIRFASSAYTPVIGDIIEYVEPMLINLTATYGAGNEPTKEQCDILFANYFEGSDNVLGTGRVRSVGKNLFDKSEALLNRRVNNVNGNIEVQQDNSASNFIEISPNQAYYFYYGSTYTSREIAFYDKNKTFISGIAGSAIISFTSPLNSKYVRLTVSIIELSNAYLVRGSTATTYEPYRESILQLTTTPLRSNGLIKDEIRKGTNGYELVKRVGVGTLGSEIVTNGNNEAALFNFTGTRVAITQSIEQVKAGTYSAKVAINDDAVSTKYIESPTLVVGKAYLIDFWYYIPSTITSPSLTVQDASGNTIATLSTTNAWTRFKILWVATSSRLRIRFSNSASGAVGQAVYYDDASIKELVTTDVVTTGSAFAEFGSNVNYTLATPTINPIAHAGLLNSNSNGIAYFEPIIADAGVYSTNLTVQLTDYPIASFESIRKYANGTYTELNIATAVIASGGLSFTHPDLVSGDLVMFTYAYNIESIGRSMTLTHYDSRFVEADTANGKVYRIVPVVTNGVVSWTAVEV